MKSIRKMKTLPGAASLGCGSLPSRSRAAPALAQDKTITLCWAAWDPANALVELSKDFTAKTRREDEVRVRALDELRRPHAQRAQLEGQALRSHHRRQPVDRRRRRAGPLRQAQRLLRQGRHQDERLRAGHGGRLCGVAEEHAELLGAAGDGRRGRLDLPQGLVRQPELQAEFKKKHNRDLARAEDLDASSSRSPSSSRAATIDGKKVYGAYIFTERGSEGITMGVTNVLYPMGFKYQNPKKPYAMDGFVNSPDAVRGLEFYKSLYKGSTPPGLTNAYMSEGLDAFKSGQVAMMMNWFAFFPGLYKDPNVGGDKIGFFANPSRQGQGRAARRPGHLGRLVLAQPQRGARSTSSGSPTPRCRRSGRRSAASRLPRRC